jgi:hypothetical protein
MLIDKYHPATVLPFFSCEVEYVLEECALQTGLICETWRIQLDSLGARCAKNKISNGNVHLLCGMWIMLGSNEHHLLHTWGK